MAKRDDIQYKNINLQSLPTDIAKLKAAVDAATKKFHDALIAVAQKKGVVPKDHHIQVVLNRFGAGLQFKHSENPLPQGREENTVDLG